MREYKKDMFSAVDKNLAAWDQEHEMRLQQASATPESILSFYKTVLKSVTDCDDDDIIEYDAETGIIQGYQVMTSCPYQLQEFVRVDCTGINIDASGSKRPWNVMTACQILRNMTNQNNG